MKRLGTIRGMVVGFLLCGVVIFLVTEFSQSDAPDAETELPAMVQPTRPSRPPSRTRDRAGGGGAVAAESARARADARMAWFSAVPQSPTWADVEEPLAAELEELAPLAHATLDEVDCRESACAATFSWPSHAAAAAMYRRLVSADIDTINCQREMSVPPPADGDTARDNYAATLVFICREG